MDGNCELSVLCGSVRVNSMTNNKHSYTRFSVEEYEAKKDELGFQGPGSRSKDGLYVLAGNGLETKCVGCNENLEIPDYIPPMYPAKVQVDGFWTTEERPLTDNDPHYTNEQSSFIVGLPGWKPEMNPEGV